VNQGTFHGCRLGSPAWRSAPDEAVSALARKVARPESGKSSGSGLAEEALFVGRLVVSLLPDEPEAQWLVALMPSAGPVAKP
jgi:hypothetical protein